jgi:uncharacterized membrane protein
VRDYVKFVLATQIVMIPLLVFNIPIARQIIGLFYLSFIPGFLVLRILSLNPESRTNIVLLSLGLSIAFVMFLGLFVSGLYPLIGISEPLAVIPLSITLSIALLLMIFVCHKKDKRELSFSLPKTSHFLQIFLATGILLMAILGAVLANTMVLLLFALAAIILVIISVLSKRLMPTELYAIVIFLIAASILFHSEFLSKYLQGWDVLGEFYVFRLTSINSLWNPAAVSAPLIDLLDYNGMLSVTILPTVYSVVLNLPGEWLFKYGYLLVYAFVPVSIYQIYKNGFGKSTAFLSAFYFILFPRFYGEERRQIIGELFLVLLIFVILNKSMKPREKAFFLGVFGASLAVSHYSISYVFMFCALFAWIILFIIKKPSLAKKYRTQEHSMSSGLILFILSVNIIWYTLVAPSLSRTLLDFGNHIVASFISGFGSVEARGGTVSEFVAPNLGNATRIYQIDYIINKIPYFLLIAGFLWLIKNRKKMNIPLEYVLMVLASMSILLMALAMPSFAPAFLAERFFHVSLLFLAPVCIFGGVMLLKLILRMLKPRMGIERVSTLALRVMCIIVVVIFLFKVGFVYEVAGDVSISRPILFMRMKNSNSLQTRALLYESYIPVQDVYSASWLLQITENSSSKIYSDETASKHVLRAYCLKIIEWKYFLSNKTIETDSYIYLRYLNTEGLFTENGVFSNITEISHQLDLTDKIYSDGSDIYYSPVGS